MRQVSPYCRYYIQAARARKELSQAKLAKQVEADVMTISRAERGLTHPRPLLCARLARSLGVSESALLALAGWLGAPVDWFDHCTSNVEMQAKGGQVLDYPGAEERKAFRHAVVLSFLLGHGAADSNELVFRARAALGLPPSVDAPDLSMLPRIRDRLVTIEADRWRVGMSSTPIARGDSIHRQLVQTLSSLTVGAFLGWVLANGGDPDEVLMLMGVSHQRSPETKWPPQEGLEWRTAVDKLAATMLPLVQHGDLTLPVDLQDGVDGGTSLWTLYRSVVPQVANGVNEVAADRDLTRADSPSAIALPADRSYPASVLERRDEPILLCHPDGGWLLRLPSSMPADAVLRVLSTAREYLHTP